MSFYTYILFSESKGVKYVGQTEDLDRRLHEHNNGLLGRFTKNKGPWKLIFSEQFETRAEAMVREKYLKSGVGRDWIKINFGI